jgi:hypothetical protein
MRNLFRSIHRFFYRQPDFCIGGVDNPYIRRWWIIPRNRVLNFYLHNFLRDDDDRAYHDHPWNFCSIILRGAYFEWSTLQEGKDYTVNPVEGTVDIFSQRAHDDFRFEYTLSKECPNLKVHRRRRYNAGSIRFRRAEFAHRIEVDPASGPIWTLFITGRTRRIWGFHCPGRWVPWQEFTKPGDKSVTGPGCGES